MTKVQQHIIGRQQIEIELNRFESSWSVQEDLSQIVQNQLQPQLEVLFDELVRPDQVVRIDNLSLDLGNLQINNLELELAPKILTAVETKLRDLMLGYTSPTEHIKKVELHATESLRDSLLHFLQTGNLPWWKKETNLATILAEWTQAIREDKYIGKSLLEFLLMHPQAFQRFLKQIPEKQRIEWTLFGLDDQDTLHKFLLVLKSIGLAIGVNEQKRKIAYEKAWELLLGKVARQFVNPSSQISTQTILQEVISNWLPFLIEKDILPLEIDKIQSRRKSSDLFKQLEILPDAVLETFFSTWKDLTDRDQWRNVFSSMQVHRFLKVSKIIARLPDKPFGEADNQKSKQKMAGEESHGKGAEVDESKSKRSHSDKGSSIESNYLEEQAFKSIINQLPLEIRGDLSLPPVFKEVGARNQQEKTESFLPKKGDFFFVDNAGIILAHPFLSILFKEFDWLQGNDFVDAAAQQAAICMLEYLSHGTTDSPEYMHLLNKVLLDWPWEMPLDAEQPLTQAQMEEGNKLLQSIIDHWGALKNASPDGLREGFLAREGKLLRAEDGWKLYVEQKAQDILLTKLPWGLSMVKLPWMKEMLTVEWG